MLSPVKSLMLVFLICPVPLWAGAGFDAEVSALAALETWQDVAASNMSSRAPGSKQAKISISSEALVGTGGSPLAQGSRPVAIVTRDFTQGPLRHTGVPTHVAIRGDEGFFTVDAGSVLTRDGEFGWDSSNTLIDKLGRPVDGEGGPIVKTLSDGPVSIDPLGNVYQAGQSINRLKIVTVEDKSLLHLTEGGFVLSDGSPTPATEVKVAPEFLEESNNKAISGMTDMMRVTRAYESVAQALSQRSEHISRAINFLGK